MRIGLSPIVKGYGIAVETGRFQMSFKRTNALLINMNSAGHITKHDTIFGAHRTPACSDPMTVGPYDPALCTCEKEKFWETIKSSLTTRQFAIIVQISQGLNTREIAIQMMQPHHVVVDERNTARQRLLELPIIWEAREAFAL